MSRMAPAEQLSLLVRLALGGILARDEPVVAILDDPLAHADLSKHRNILNILRIAAEGGPSWRPPAGRMQILIFNLVDPDRFDHLPGARHINLGQVVPAVRLEDGCEFGRAGSGLNTFAPRCGYNASSG